MPGTTDGATVLVLKAKRLPYNVSLGADLRQPRSRAVLTGAWYDPFAAGSELSASTLVGDFSREKLFTLGYSQLVGTDGLTTKASFLSYRGYPDEQSGRGARIDRFNTNRRVELSASYPLYLTARSSLTLGGGFYAVDNIDHYRVPASGALLDEDTRVRALFAQLAYADAQSDRSRYASLVIAQAIDGAGALAENRSNVAGLSGPGEAGRRHDEKSGQPDSRRVLLCRQRHGSQEGQRGSRAGWCSRRKPRSRPCLPTSRGC
ncbi:hypothetical protein J7E70_25835 [Variovorax paradoxus]|nr:hypothetical protein [Variovorax paradoxus]